jgi:hypothetical protein
MQADNLDPMLIGVQPAPIWRVFHMRAPRPVYLPCWELFPSGGAQAR